MSTHQPFPMKQFRCPNGMHFWNAPESRGETNFIYREIFDDRCYEKHGVAVADGDIVFDVGANIGMFTRSLMGRFRDLRVYCFEPVPNTRACLERNIGECPDRSKHRVDVLDFALGADETQATIEFFAAAPGNSTLYPKEKAQEFNAIADELRVADVWKTQKGAAVLMLLLYPFRRMLLRKLARGVLDKTQLISCRVRKLSNVIREQDVRRIDLLKVDVEGAELDVLAGIEDEHWPLIRQMAIEVSPANKPRIAALSERLKALGFTRVVMENALRGGDDPNEPGPCVLYAARAA